MAFYLKSDCGNWITVLEEDGFEENFTLQEFIERYGEDAVPHNEYESGNLILPSSASELKKIMHYYALFEKLCIAAGKYAWADKLRRNHEDGIFPVQKVVYDTFGPHGAATKLDIEIDRRNMTMRHYARKLNEASCAVGYLPMRDVDLETLMNHLYNRVFRTRMLYRVRKYAKKAELKSARELVIEVLESFRRW